MHLHSHFDGMGDTTRPVPATTVSGTDRPRVDLRWVLTGLRHLPGSAEPARVFNGLAVVGVPALCDQMVIDTDENGVDDEAGLHRYRIRQPGGPPWPEIGDPSSSLDPG